MNNKGYTLVELLAVTVVLGLILVIAVPSVQNIMEISERNTFLADAQAIYRAANTEVLKALKKLSLNYVSLTNNFTNKSKIFEFIITADRINLDYEMKMLRDFSYESVNNINEKLMLFYENAEKRIIEIEGLINESINTAS